MAQLRQDYVKFVEKSAEVLVVGPEDRAAFQKYWNDNDLNFIGLPDPDHKVLNLYGQEIRLLKMGRMPAQVLIDEKGIIRAAHYGQSMMDIPDNEDILAVLDELGRENVAA